MEAARPEPACAEDIRHQLQAEGVDTTAPAEDQPCDILRLFPGGREALCSATCELEKLRRQQAEEMREVENYVDHVRNLTEARDALATKFEQENELLRRELAQLQLEHESQQKEAEEMLAQEGLLGITRSGPSEQVAYLLTERRQLLETITALEQQPDSSCCLEHFCAAHLQPQAEELARGRASSKQAERDLDKAPRRLQGVRGKIRRLTGQLEPPKGEPSRQAPSMTDCLQEETEEEKKGNETPEAGEPSCPLDQEISALLNRVRFLDLTFLPRFLDRADNPEEELPKSAEDDLRASVAEMDPTKDLEGGLLLQSKKKTAEAEEGDVLDEAAGDHENIQTLHKRCHQVVERVELQNAQLLRKLQKLEREHEDLVERNEELESLLGETQNQSQDEREQLESEVDRLQRKISRLESELRQGQKMKTEKTEEAMAREVAGCQKRLKIHQAEFQALEGRLLEEEEQRQQLTQDLEVTQKALKEEKKELSNSRAELLRLYGEIQALRGAAEERDFLHVTHEKLRQEKLLLEAKVSELSQRCEQLSQLVTEGETPGERGLASRRMAREDLLAEPFPGQGEEGEQLRLQLLESSRRTEELEEQLRGSREEKTLLWEENAQLRNEILALRHQLSTHSPATVKSKLEAGFGEHPPPMAQASVGSTDGEVNQGPPGEKLLQQQEELQQLRHDVHRVQNLCRSTEKELRHEREKNLELKKHNISLQQENIKVKAELREVQLKLSEASEACSSLTSQGDLVRQQVKELQLELLKQSHAAKQRSSLQEKLAQEKARAAEAERTIAELQQTLRDSQHQVQLWGKKQLEEVVKEAQEKQTKAQRQLLEEQQKRKILDQRAEDLQQQLRLAREKEAQLVRTCAEGELKAQQLQAQLRVLEEEKKTLSNEHLHCQKYSQKVAEQLLAVQQEKEALHEEYERILEQVDLSIRKNNERKLRHKAKLRRAKETFISEVKQRDIRIRHLENELKFSQSQREKNQALIRRVATENEGLLQKKTKLSQRLLDLEKADQSHQQVLSAMQSRLHFFNEENKRLQERIFQLTGQVGALERALRNIHSHNLEELKSIGFSECQLQTQMRPLPNLSLSVRGLSDSRALPKAIEDGQVQEPAEKPLLSPPSFQSSEIGYLNVASPGEPADLHQETLTQPFGCDRVQRAGEDL